MRPESSRRLISTPWARAKSIKSAIALAPCGPESDIHRFDLAERVALDLHVRRTRQFPSGGWGIASNRLEEIPGAALLLVRSEERRVGKECRSRWSPYH